MFKEDEDVDDDNIKESTKIDSKTLELVKKLNELTGKICLNSNGKTYYVSEFSVVEESTKKIEEKHFFRFKEIDKVIPEFINEVITINGSKDKVISFTFDEDGKNEKISYYTLEDLIYNFENDRNRYLTTKESLNKLGYIITK